MVAIGPKRRRCGAPGQSGCREKVKKNHGKHRHGRLCRKIHDRISTLPCIDRTKVKESEVAILELELAS